MREYSSGPLEMFGCLLKNRELVYAMAKRDAVGRYRGSILGLAWSFFNPLLTLVVYTFVFSVVFKARWAADADESRIDFAVILFAGIIVYGIFAECVNRAPTIITTNTNYVKKVIFPLEVLPWIALFSALFHAFVSLCVLLTVQFALKSYIPPTVVLFPLVMAPLLLGVMGVSWALAALGVYLRDIGHVTGLLVTVMLYMSAVFFPISALPVRFQFWLTLNPLAMVIEQSRQVLIFGQMPDGRIWLTLMLIGYVVAWGGFACFQKTRRGFADVL